MLLERRKKKRVVITVPTQLSSHQRISRLAEDKLVRQLCDTNENDNKWTGCVAVISNCALSRGTIAKQTGNQFFALSSLQFGFRSHSRPVVINF